MPHFIIECSENVLNFKSKDEILRKIYKVAEASQLFAPNDIKVRLNSFKDFIVGKDNADFIHVFASIMEGRSTEQKAQLSKEVVKNLIEILPEVPNIAMNVDEFEKSTYCNRKMM
ncbi:5-carboxymethyl-2-hydroxymuconate Delta-isomerase [Xanthovirga aplysinae]|uniref:5-carboxymethyl-2-hydroxymuconate Delta-isomerase n=1 Tax=Xanthovirga aplysinae TaxID=2529853 RepID=UPI0012BCD9CA|nr:5-carboxymethyl-2-hydroxymuconate Delta-isomerase [Xanthovirga aplysinae]MTI31202.1 5-carboxymethyl-2-hydroxymuconate Delta-isomerase [Xanthovirga aplysinae]